MSTSQIPNIENLSDTISSIAYPTTINVQTQWYLFMFITVIYFIIRWMRSGKEYDSSVTEEEISQWDSLWLLAYVCFSITVQILTNFTTVNMILLYPILHI